MDADSAGAAETSYSDLEALVEPASSRVRVRPRSHRPLPAQDVRRFVRQFFSDPAEVDDVVEEILAVCVEDFADLDSDVPIEKWVLVVASRVVAGRWRNQHFDY